MVISVQRPASARTLSLQEVSVMLGLGRGAMGVGQQEDRVLIQPVRQNSLAISSKHIPIGIFLDFAFS